MKHPDQPDYTVGIAGCGAMGQGIAQVSVQGGMRTILFDARAGGAAAAAEKISTRLKRLAEKGRMTDADAAAAAALLMPADDIASFTDADCIVEAVFEDLDVKHSLFKKLEGVVRPDCVLASNTSSIPLASIARVCEGKGRIAGLHFFNPVPLMKLVEVIRAAETSDETINVLMALGRRMTRTPVEVKDSPGFLVNMGGRAYTTEGNRIEHEGVAAPEQVDAIMRDCWGFRMGPFELMDLTGIDVNYPVSGIVYRGYNEDPRLKTSANHLAKFDAGMFGRKTGRGWFSYEGGKPKDRPSPDHVTDAKPARAVAISGGDVALEEAAAEIGADAGDLLGLSQLQDFCAEIGLKIVEDDGACPILAAPMGPDATHVAIDGGVDPARLVCLDLCGNTSKRVTVMTPPGADLSHRDAVAAAIAASGRAVTAIKDSPGFVGQRMVAMIANLGCYMAEVGLATPEDIDTAMQLGLNYPHGSISLTEQLGVETTELVLTALQQITGEDRYRPTLWLKRRAMLGLPIHTPN